MKRFDWLRAIHRLDADTDFAEIYRIMVAHEFPWDMTQALSFALFRTYAVPGIGNLLYRTGELTERAQKRYDDTGLLLDAVLEHGFDSETGRAAIRRINQMHRCYPISNEDLRYVLCTFVVVPIRWMDRYGWRRLSETERVASANYYRELGRHMGIRGVPGSHQEFAAVLDDYEAAHFGYDDGARAVADSTLELMTTTPPYDKLPNRAVQLFARALMDGPLLVAFRYPAPPRIARVLAHGGLWLRGRVVRLLPPRTEPLHARHLPQIRSYPDGYDVRRLGTFPPGCPVPHDGPQPARMQAAASSWSSYDGGRDSDRRR